MSTEGVETGGSTDPVASVVALPALPIPTSLPAAVQREMWVPEIQAYRQWLVGVEGRKPSGAYRYCYELTRNLVPYAIAHNILPGDPVLATPEFAVEYKRDVVDKIKGTEINRRVNMRSFERFITGDYKMAVKPPVQQQDPIEDEDEGGEDEEAGGEEEEQAQSPAPKRQAQQQQAAPPPQVVFVQSPAQRGRPPGPTGPRPPPRQPVDPFKGILPQENFQKVSVYKRDRMGKLIYVEQYTLKEIGNTPMAKFIKDVVDPNSKDPSGFTSYQVFKVDAATGQDIQPSIEINVESDPVQQQDDDIGKAKTAIEMLGDLRAMEGERSNQMAEILEVAKKKAEAGGSMTEMMMLMMMSKVLDGGGKSDESALMKILDRIGTKAAPQPDWAQMMAQMQPPPPPPQSELGPIVAKLLEVQVSPKQEKTLTDQAKDLAVLRDLFQPREDPIMRAMLEQMKALTEKLSQPAAVSGIDNALAQFTKVTEMVKTLAPAINMGGFASMFQNIMTPSLAQVIGNALAKGMSTATAGTPQPQPAQQRPVPIPAPVAPAPPQAAIPHMVAFKSAKTEPEAIAAMLAILKELYQDQAWTPILTPYVQAFTAGDYNKVSEFIAGVVKEIRPELMIKPFIDKVVDAAFAQVYAQMGTPPPKRPSPVSVVPPPQAQTTAPASIPAPVSVPPPSTQIVEAQPSPTSPVSEVPAPAVSAVPAPSAA